MRLDRSDTAFSGDGVEAALGELDAPSGNLWQLRVNEKQKPRLFLWNRRRGGVPIEGFQEDLKLRTLL